MTGLESAAERMRRHALSFLAEAKIGSRVVVRALDGDGASDALGDLIGRDDQRVEVMTRRGAVSMALAAVVAAKAVPPAPQRRRR